MEDLPRVLVDEVQERARGDPAVDRVWAVPREEERFEGGAGWLVREKGQDVRAVLRLQLTPPRRQR